MTVVRRQKPSGREQMPEDREYGIRKQECGLRPIEAYGYTMAGRWKYLISDFE
jgi:hypothetical protein